jgi:hypothetical protein
VLNEVSSNPGWRKLLSKKKSEPQPDPRRGLVVTPPWVTMTKPTAVGHLVTQ